jgi:predicted HTH transcriptional regulator
MFGEAPGNPRGNVYTNLYRRLMLTAEEVAEALQVGHEVRGFEIKGPGSRDDKHLFAKVARGALSMGNLRDGGTVLIGVDDAAPEQMLPGLSEEDLAGWMDFDTISARLAEYADPPLHLEITSVMLPTGARVALIEVDEFAEVPHLCARDYEKVLRKGALYVRSRKKPETAEIPSSNEMRDVLDLATEKRLRAYVQTAERAGVALTATIATEIDEIRESSERFDAQVKDAWNE